MGRAVVVILAFGVCLAAGGILLGTPATGQDRTQERLSALETRVALLEEHAGFPQDATPSVPAESAGAHGAITLSGDGSGVTEDFDLSAGRFLARGEVSGNQGFTHISVQIYGTDGQRGSYILQGSADEDGPVVFEEIFMVEGDTYFLEVSSSGPWTLIISPR